VEKTGEGRPKNGQKTRSPAVDLGPVGERDQVPSRPGKKKEKPAGSPAQGKKKGGKGSHSPVTKKKNKGGDRKPFKR